MNSATVLLDANASARRRNAFSADATCNGPELSYLLISPSGVLYDDTPWWRWMLQVLSRFGLHMDATAFTTLWRRDYYDTVCSGRCEFFDAFGRFLLQCGMHAGQVDEICAAGRSHWRQLEIEQRTFPQTALALADLAQRGWRMGLLVYGPLSANETRRQLDRMGILRHFEHLICSGEIDATLTEQRAWTGVLDQLGVPAESVGYLAHDDRLLSTAHAFGVTAMAYQCSHARADLHLRELRELRELPSFAHCGPAMQAA